MKVRTGEIASYFMLTFAVALHGQVAQQNQSGAQFSARQILPPAVYQASTYKVADLVTVVDHKFHFNIETPYGVFPVNGIVLFEKRLSELRAIEEAARLSNQAVAVQGAWQTVKQTPRGAGHLFSDPLGTCLLYTSPSPRDATLSRMPSSA